jgi:hypothetical protein
VAIKKPTLRRPTIRRGLVSRRFSTCPCRVLQSNYPSPPRELAGKWVAWSRDRQIVASGDTLAGVVATVASLPIEDASYERVPRFDRLRAR